METRCYFCKQDLGALTSDEPLTTQTMLCFEKGRCKVSWENCKPHFYGFICYSCKKQQEQKQQEFSDYCFKKGLSNLTPQEFEEFDNLPPHLQEKAL